MHPISRSPTPSTRSSGDDVANEVTFVVERRVGHSGDAIVLRVAGDVDAFSQPGLDDALTAALDVARAARVGHLVVDLGAVRFCSVSGMRALARTSQIAVADGILVEVAGMSGLQRRMVELIWPSSFPKRHENVAEALSAGAPGPGGGSSSDRSSTVLGRLRLDG